jgi:hypothetical protein
MLIRIFIFIYTKRFSEPARAVSFLIRLSSSSETGLRLSSAALIKDSSAQHTTMEEPPLDTKAG